MVLKTFSEVKNPQEMEAYLKKMLGERNYQAFTAKFKNLEIHHLQHFANTLFEDWLIRRNISLHKIDFANFAFGSAGFRSVVEEISKNDNSFFVKSFVFAAELQKKIQPLSDEIFFSLALKHKKNINLFKKFEEVFSSSELSKKYPDAFELLKYDVKEDVRKALLNQESLKRGSDSFREYLGQSFNKMMKGWHFKSKVANHKRMLARQEKYAGLFDKNFSQNFYPEYYNKDSSALRPFSGKDFEDGQDFRKKLNALLKYPKNINLLDNFIKNLQGSKLPLEPQDLEKFYVKLANDIFCAKHDESLPKTKRKSPEFREYLENEFKIFQEFLKQKNVLNIENNNKRDEGWLETIAEESEPEELEEGASSSSDLASLYSDDFDLVTAGNEARAAEAPPSLNYSPKKIVGAAALTGSVSIPSPLFSENEKTNPLPDDDLNKKSAPTKEGTPPQVITKKPENEAESTLPSNKPSVNPDENANKKDEEKESSPSFSKLAKDSNKGNPMLF